MAIPPKKRPQRGALRPSSGDFAGRNAISIAISRPAMDRSLWSPFTRAKVERRPAQLEESVARYVSQLDTADRQEPTEALTAKVTRLTEKPTKLKEEMGKLAVYEKEMRASPDQQISLTGPDSRSMATRAWFRRRRLHRAGRRGYDAPSDCDA
jgi:hypothetical protein